MNSEKSIDIYKVRDFGELLQDSIRFVLLNAWPLLKAILIFIGPLILISGIASVWYFRDFIGSFDPATIMQDPDSIAFMAQSMLQDGSFFTIIGFGVLFSVAFYATRNLFINSFILRYGETETGALSISDLSADFFKNIGPFLGLHLLQIVIYIVTLIVFGLMMGLLGAATGGSFLMFILVLAGMLLAFVYVWMPLMFSYIIRLNEGPDNIQALRRSYQIAKEYRWQTFFLLVVLAIISAVVSLILSVLGLETMMGDGFGLLVYTILNSVVSTLIGVMFSVAIALQYFSTIGPAETTDDLIDQIGNDDPADSF